MSAETEQHLVLAVSTVIFSLRPDPETGELTLWLPLVRRIREPFKNRWALPGGPLDNAHDLAEAANNTMQHTTQVQPRHLEQLYAFGDVDRSPEAPERVVSIVYWALVGQDEDLQVVDAENVEWHPVEEIPGPLAFDHDLIVRYAVDRLRAKVTYSPIAHAFLPEEFSLADLRRVYEAILNRALDPSNFRRQILSQGTVQDTGRRMTGTAHRPPKLYRSAPQSSRYALTIEENP
ncbi:NUDIX hydrolase [Nesterenkonia sphaerica]|uniref:NUDIX domain-containing protein n=1 Tax=Nesterenkonia sphaerica TaxID=1804988 RepID=A0A5R9A418_9MICC|nr:NUDIX domain-containing protein [Nesterenkonia sphaerica]TLP72934.1 NUDIX domain-containing protein [Nesterenkonia sphaerica]